LQIGTIPLRLVRTVRVPTEAKHEGCRFDITVAAVEIGERVLRLPCRVDTL
jgi:hypothetical protein